MRPGLDWPPEAGAAAEAQTYDLLPAPCRRRGGAGERAERDARVEMSTTLY